MGFNTVAVLFNDCTGGEMPKEINDAVRCVDVGEPRAHLRRFGYGATICQAHADWFQVAVIGHNTGWSLDDLPTEHEGQVIWTLKAFLENRGYRVVKTRKRVKVSV